MASPQRRRPKKSRGYSYVRAFEAHYGVSLVTAIDAGHRLVYQVSGEDLIVHLARYHCAK